MILLLPKCHLTSPETLTDLTNQNRASKALTLGIALQVAKWTNQNFHLKVHQLKKNILHFFSVEKKYLHSEEAGALVE